MIPRPRHLFLHQRRVPYINTISILYQIHIQSTKAANVSKAFHRYALNYINALNYLETLRRQQEFSDFEKVPFWCLNVYLPTLYVIQVCKYMNIYKIKHEYFRFQWCNKDPRCKKLQLTDLLVAPVHHIMKV